jgi:hypothetical protein
VGVLAGLPSTPSGPVVIVGTTALGALGGAFTGVAAWAWGSHRKILRLEGEELSELEDKRNWFRGNLQRECHFV